MAKEMMIVFVYDTLRCHSESEDPAEAVLYFHPGWVSDAQRHALCGQIVGTAHCVASLLSQPAAITLQSGKFLIREYGRYILAIGSDRNIPDWVLKNRAQLLTSMIKVYHGDLATIAAQFPGENNPRFAEKLYQMLETYLPVLQFGCHIFQRVPMLSLPKSATSIYMESMQILEYCQQIKGVLGGVILYNNKIVASQLSPKLTSHLTVVDPYRIKSPAEVCQTDAPLPLGAQLLVVYVAKKDYALLKKNANKIQEFNAEPNELVNKFKKNGEMDPKPAPTSGMKRDKSLLFTAVPEEDVSLISPPNSSDDSHMHPRINEENKQKNNMPDVVPFTNKPRPRPNKLSLSLKTTASIDECISEKCELERVFTGHTSVCSTPMVEFKRLHVNVLSICQNPDTQLPAETTGDYSFNSEPDVLKTTEKSVPKQKTEVKSKMDETQLNNGTEHFITKPVTARKLGSVSDIQESFKRLSDRASAKFRSRKSKVQTQSNTASPAKDKPNGQIMFRTITDPTYPVFRNDGVPISKALFMQYLEEYYADMNGEDMSKMENMFKFEDSKENMHDENRIEGFDSEMTWSPKHVVEKKVQDIENVKPAPTPNVKPDVSRRKSLSLPLKSLNDDGSQQSESDAVFDGQSSRRRLSGVQLTPLMEKLSHLAFSDKSSGYGSRVMTPLEVRDFATPNLERRTSFSECLRRQKSSSESDSDSEDDLDLLPEYTKHSVKAALFICGLQNMALMVVMDVAAANNPDAINALWETSLNTLGPIEQKCMEPLPTNNDSTEYSYLTLDPDWGTIKKGGPWASLDIATMGLIHNELGEDKTLSEIILRTEESVVLGASCGGAEIYYQESGVKQAGVPMPSDIMATVQLKAKRRLHRDHSVVVL